MSDIKTKMRKLNQEIEAKKQELKKQSETLFRESVKEIFTKYPTLESFSWTQYTPYFNDGEPCEFSVNDPGIYLVDDKTSEEDIDYYEGDISSWGLKDELKTCKDENRKNVINRQLSLDHDIKALFQIHEDVFKNMFGDHAGVKVFKDNIEVEEYEHE